MFYFVFVFVCVFVDLDKEQAELWLLCPPGATVQATPGQSLVNDPTFAARLQVANCQVIQNITCSISRKKVISIIYASYHFHAIIKISVSAIIIFGSSPTCQSCPLCCLGIVWSPSSLPRLGNAWQVQLSSRIYDWVFQRHTQCGTNHFQCHKYCWLNSHVKEVKTFVVLFPPATHYPCKDLDTQTLPTLQRHPPTDGLFGFHLQPILLAGQVSQPGQRSALAGCYAHLILVIYLHVFHTNLPWE